MKPLVPAAILTLLTMSLWSAVQAQGGTGNSYNQPNSTFKLNAEQQHQLPGEGVRIQRNRLAAGASQQVMPAQPLNAMTGAQSDSNKFGLRADDWAAKPKAVSAPLSATVSKSKPLTASAAQQRTITVKELANFDLELIVDQSQSMKRRDCPGGASRWEWCGMQLSNLSNQLSAHSPRGFTLTTFASEFQSYPNATEGDVQRLFGYAQLASGTRLSRPLGARLGHYFANRTANSKPLLIVVITDGAPTPAQDGVLVAGNLISASRQITRPGEVNVVFFQIGGGDPFGRIFLNQMDHSLVRAGAKHDIVQTVSFEQLQRQGLTNSLVNAIRSFRTQSSR